MFVSLCLPSDTHADMVKRCVSKTKQSKSQGSKQTSKQMTDTSKQARRQRTSESTYSVFISVVFVSFFEDADCFIDFSDVDWPSVSPSYD